MFSYTRIGIKSAEIFHIMGNMRNIMGDGFHRVW